MTLKAKIENGIVYSPYPPIDVPDISAYTAIKDCLSKWGDKIALIENDVTVTFDDVLTSIRRAAAGYQTYGMQRGDHVCMYFGNTLASFIAGFGLVAAGATVVLEKAQHNLREVTYEVKDSNCTYIVTDKYHIDIVNKLNEEMKFKGMFSIDDVAGYVYVGHFQKLSDNEFKEVKIADPKNEVLAIIYSSGTTGLPKGVEMSHRAYAINMASASAMLPASEKDIFLASSPITHISGFLFTMAALSQGASCVIGAPIPTFKEFYEVVSKYKVSNIFFFPTYLQSTVEVMEHTGLRTPSIRKISIGGGVLPVAVAKKVLEFFQPETLKNIYGMTESCGLVSASLYDNIAYDTIGYPAPNVQIKIQDADTGKLLGVGEKGELVVKIPNVMLRYRNRPKETAEVLSKDGWLRTGDCAYYDDTGKLFYVERLKEMIKCMDHQVNPAELEELLIQHPAVAEASVVGIPSQKVGEAPTAFVVLKPSHIAVNSVKPEEVKEKINAQCAPFKQLHGGLYFVDHLPKTETGKVLRSKLRKDPPVSK